MATPTFAQRPNRATASLTLADTQLSGRVSDDLAGLMADAEAGLAALGAALRLRNPVEIEQAAMNLRTALQETARGFGAATSRARITPELLARLAAAREAASTLHEGVARASFVLDHTVAILRPAALPGQG